MCIVLTLLSALLLFGTARPAVAATPCANGTLTAPTTIIRTQVISDTVQIGPNLFVCRVDGAGTLANGTGTRSVTSIGLILLVVARWLHFVGYALAFGVITFGLWATATGDQTLWTPRVWRLIQIGIGLLLSAEPLALLAQTIGVQNTLFDLTVAGDVLASGFGLVWAQRVGLALLLWVIIGMVKDGAVRALWAAPLLGIVLAIVDALANAGNVRLPVIAIAAATLHEAAMGIWIGGLALLLVVWQTLERDPRAMLLKRFSRLSGAAIGLLSITGLTMVTLRLTQPADLFQTLYGAIFSIKFLVALLAIGLATFGQRMYRTIWRWRAALATLIVLLGVASLLVSMPAP